MKHTNRSNRKPYAVCGYCGAHLDHGERCDCNNRTAVSGAILCVAQGIKKEAAPLQRESAPNKNNLLTFYASAP